MKTTKCSRCDSPNRPTHRWCAPCHAAYTREWRKTHRLAGEARKRANARSYTTTYIKRGKLKRLPCEVCGEPRSEAHHDDYTRPLEVRWLCRRHHLEHHRLERLEMAGYGPNPLHARVKSSAPSSGRKRARPAPAPFSPLPT